MKFLYLLLLFAISTNCQFGPRGPFELPEEKKEILGRYLITSSKTIRPGSKYSVTVNLLRDLSPTTKITVEIRDDKNETIASTVDPSVRLGESKTVTIDKVPASGLLEGGNYFVYVKGESGDVEFEEQQQLTLNMKSLSIFVQTDKAIYKPGSKVQYRIIVVKPNLKPYKGTVTVKVIDPNQNIIAMFKDSKLDRGVMSKEMALSAQPPLGQWTIEVQPKSSDKFEKTFDVDKYVLPKFSVELEPPSIMTLKDDLKMTLRAKYTYGKPVDGIGKITVKYPWDWGGNFGPSRSPLWHKPIEVTGQLKDGILEATFSNKDMRARELIEGNYGGTLKVLGEVLEELTGNKREAEEKDININRHPFKMEMHKSTEHFKPGLPFSVLVSLKMIDDTPLRPQDRRKVAIVSTMSFPITDEDQQKIDAYHKRENERREKERKELQKLIDSGAIPDYPSYYGGPPPPGLALPPPPLEGEIQPLGEGEVITRTLTPFRRATPEPFNYPTPPPPVKNIQYVTLDADGTKPMEFEIPEGTENVNINAYYLSNKDVEDLGDIENIPWERRNKLNLIDSSTYASSADSPSDNFIMVVPESQEAAKAGTTKTFRIHMTENIGSVSMQVISRGYVVASMDQNIRGKNGVLRVPVTAEMAPKAKLVVYGIRQGNQEVLVDAVEFNVDGLFQNEVSVNVNPLQVEPGNDVTVKVQADPGSLVGLMAVDQSVLLLKSGNDITQEMVKSDVELYGRGFGAPWGPWFRRAKRSIWFPWGINGQDADSIFRNAGLLVMSDALIHKKTYNHRGRFMTRGGGGGGPLRMMSAPMAFASPPRQESATMALADSGGGLGGLSKQAKSGKSAVKVRSEFPETWIWTEKETERNGYISMNAKVPDTITSWVISAFGVNDKSGLGVADTAKLKVFRPFFVSLNLPYSVKRGEKVAIQVLVFNYLERKQTVTIELDDSGKGFDIIQKSGTPVKNSLKNKKAAFNTRRVEVDGNGGSATVFFPIRPKIIGDIQLEIKARGQGAADALRRPLKVEPEGFRVHQTKPVMIDLSEQASFKESLTPEIPTNDPDFVQGSAGAELQLIGDVMGPVLSNIDDLVRMPYGCGEQNMVNFVPNIVVMKTLKATQRLEPAIEAKALKYMEAGYQRELTYKRKDHSFSAFGDSDKNGSTWLTAFVVKSFHQAKPYIFIDDKVMNESIGYLQSKQLPNGEYQEDKPIIHGSLTGGGSEAGIPLTAYVVAALLENGVRDRQGIQYLENNLDGNKITDPYGMALVTYALHLAESPMKDTAFNRLKAMSTQKDGFESWEEEEKKSSKDTPFYWRDPPPANVEMTSYALLTYLLRDMTGDSLPIVRWLSSKRNSNGGWSSTQDTVVALQALGDYSQESYSPNFDVSATVKNGGPSSNAQFKITPENSLILKTYKVGNIRRPVEIEASGSGVITAQLNWHYNLKTDSKNAPFSCKAQDATAKRLRNSELHVKICCRYTKGEDKSGMAVLETDALSGYEFDEEEMDKLPDQVELIQKVEYEKSGTKMDVYFDHLSKKRTCFTMKSTKGFKVGDRKPAQVVVYDYYKPQDRVEFKWSAKGPENFEQSCPDCWPLLNRSGNCKDQTRGCGSFCDDDRKDGAFKQYIQRHSRWLRMFCQNSCAVNLNIRKCL